MEIAAVETAGSDKSQVADTIAAFHRGLTVGNENTVKNRLAPEAVISEIGIIDHSSAGYETGFEYFPR